MYPYILGCCTVSPLVGGSIPTFEDILLDLIKTFLAEALVIIKTLFAESLENTLVAGSCLFLIIAFVAAIVEPKAALVPLVLGVVFYGFARLQDNS